MNKFIKVLSQQLSSDFLFFYRELGFRIFISVLLSILVGFLDGIGLTMFIPLLQIASEGSDTNSNSLGNLQFVLDGIASLGIPLSIVSVLIVMIVFFCLKGIASFSANAYRIVVQQYFVRSVRVKLLGKLNNLSFKSFMVSDVGRIQNTMSGEIERLAQAYNFYFATFQNAVLVGVYVLFAFFVDSRFAILVTVGGLLTNFIYKVFYKKTKIASRKLTKDSNIYQGQIIEHVGNYMYLKATGLIKVYGNKLIETILKIEKSRRRIGMLNSFLGAAREPLLIIVVAVVIIIQTQIFDASMGLILLSLLFFYRALSSLLQLQHSWNRFLEVSGSLENLVNFEEQLDAGKGRNGSKKVSSIDELLLKNSSVELGGKRILRSIDLNIKKYETVAFIGESGSGKTTLVNVLAGLLPLDEGNFMINGISVEDIDILSYQKRLGYITQNAVVFNDTISNNITFWNNKSENNDNSLEEVLQKASLLGLINKLDAGIQTEIGHNGINLSGGQKQRLAIARELYKDIDLLIMDEATSALDSETEKNIQEHIDRLRGQYTILIVAHRLSTIKNADRIVLMKEGKIEQVGSYEELIESSSLFKRMIEFQQI